ncbi:MAG: efflux RND transporter periplasmic adaptor subunit, partial [Gammaproteobacteria bacterium]
MKKYNTYLGILAVGLLLGWLLFGNSRTNETEHSHSETEETNRMWTCSMHPQIMQPEDGDCPICGMELIPAEISADGLTTIVFESNGECNVIKLSGKIDKNEKENVVQVSYLSGRIERLYVSFTGEKVSKGQLLATIYSPELYSAQQELITASSLKESQPVLYKAVRNKLKLMKLSEKQINEIETTGKVKEIFPVYATVSGTVTDKLVEQGDYIKQGQTLLKIANLNTVWANFDVYENQIELLKKGQEVDIKINSYPNEGFKGKVSFIDPVLNTRTRTVKLRAVLNNTNDKFKPGMFVEGKIKGVSSNKVQLLSIPSAAVLWTGERSVIYLKSNPTKPFFEMREV